MSTSNGLDTPIPALFLHNVEGNKLLSLLESNPNLLIYMRLDKVEECKSGIVTITMNYHKFMQEKCFFDWGCCQCPLVNWNG